MYVIYVISVYGMMYTFHLSKIKKERHITGTQSDSKTFRYFFRILVERTCSLENEASTRIPSCSLPDPRRFPE